MKGCVDGKLPPKRCYLSPAHPRPSIAMRSVIASFFLGLSLSACSLFEGDDAPEAPPLSQLHASAEVLTVGGKDLVLSTSLSRDFMPIAPPEGRALIAVFYISTSDSSAFPDGVTSDAAFVVNGDEVWATYYTGEDQEYHQRPYRIVEIARNGPKWGPNVKVDAVVRLRDSSGNTYLLRSPNQLIGSTS